MNKQKTEDMLKLYPNINKRILALNQDLGLVIQAEKYSLANVKAMKISDMPKGKNRQDKILTAISQVEDNLQDVSNNLVEYIRYMRYYIDALTQTKIDIDEVLGLLTKEERDIIELRYWKYPSPPHTWDNVVKESPYEKRQCISINELALKKIGKILNIA